MTLHLVPRNRIRILYNNMRIFKMMCVAVCTQENILAIVLSSYERVLGKIVLLKLWKRRRRRRKDLDLDDNIRSTSCTMSLPCHSVTAAKIFKHGHFIWEHVWHRIGVTFSGESSIYVVCSCPFFPLVMRVCDWITLLCRSFGVSHDTY